MPQTQWPGQRRQPEIVAWAQGAGTRRSSSPSPIFLWIHAEPSEPTRSTEQASCESALFGGLIASRRLHATRGSIADLDVAGKSTLGHVLVSPSRGLGGGDRPLLHGKGRGGEGKSTPKPISDEEVGVHTLGMLQKLHAKVTIELHPQQNRISPGNLGRPSARTHRSTLI